MAAEARSKETTPLPASVPAEPSGDPICLACAQKLSAEPLRPGIRMYADGSDHLIEFRQCTFCQLAIAVITRQADGRKTLWGPVTLDQAEAYFQLPPYCGDPGRSSCDCESHRFFRFLYFKHDWAKDGWEKIKDGDPSEP